MDADRELELMIQALGFAEATRLWEAQGRAPRPSPSGDAVSVSDDELPPILRARKEPPKPAAPEPPIPPPAPPAGRTFATRGWAAAAAALLAVGIAVFVGALRRDDTASPVPFDLVGTDVSSPTVRVPRATPPLVSDGTWEPVAIPKSEGMMRLRRTMSDVELDLMEHKLRGAIRRDGLDLPEQGPGPHEPEVPERGRPPRSGMVRFAKATS